MNDSCQPRCTLVPVSQRSTEVQHNVTAAPALVALFAAEHAISDALEAEMRGRCGINSGQFQVLMALAGAPDGQLRMADIAATNCISRSGVTQSVDRLETLGHVTRMTSSIDRRLVLAKITSSGLDMIPIGHQIFESVAARFITGRLSLRQSTNLLSALTAIATTDPAPEANSH